MHSFPYKHFSQDALAGLLAGVVFTVVASASLFVYLPAFALLFCGLSNGHKSMSVACGIGCIVVALAMGIQGLFFFALILALPSAYFVKHALLWRNTQENPQWYPVERIIVELTLVAASFFMVFALLVANDRQGGLQAIATHSFSRALPDAPPEIAALMHHLASDWSFLVFAMAGWVWVLLIYGLAVAANHLLNTRHRALRRNLALSWSGLPAWLPGLVSICALLALFGTGNDRFCAKALLLLLLLPYFLTGLARIHVYTLGRRHRGLWLIALYVFLFTLQWAAVPLVMLGLYSQISEMLDKPHKIR